jgi:Regulator of G protein signaling domain
MRDARGRMLFTKFLESELASENIKFWETIEEYREKPAELLVGEAIRVWKQYLCLDPEAPDLVNIPGTEHKKLAALLASRATHASITHWTFDSCQDHIYALMKTDSLRRFARSDMFKGFLAVLAKETEKDGSGGSSSTLVAEMLQYQRGIDSIDTNSAMERLEGKASSSSSFSGDPMDLLLQM